MVVLGLLRERGSPSPDREVGGLTFPGWLSVALLRIGIVGHRGGGVDNHLPMVRNQGKLSFDL